MGLAAPDIICYHSVNVISFVLAQSDHIKWGLLYVICNLFSYRDFQFPIQIKFRFELSYCQSVLGNFLTLNSI
jgi:hypothetical protein